MNITKPKSDAWKQQDFVNKIEVKICDLGLSKPLELEGTGTFCGTANFICPENLLGFGYDFKADVWALGSLTFELMTGWAITSFFDPSKQSLDAKFIDGNLYLPQLDSMTLECVDFLAKCL